MTVSVYLHVVALGGGQVKPKEDSLVSLFHQHIFTFVYEYLSHDNYLKLKYSIHKYLKHTF